MISLSIIIPYWVYANSLLFSIDLQYWGGKKVKERREHQAMCEMKDIALGNVRNERYKYINTIINNKLNGHQNY